MNIKRIAARIVLGGEEPEIVKDAIALHEQMRSDPAVQRRRRDVAARVRKELLVAAIPGLLVAIAAAYFGGPIVADLLNVPTVFEPAVAQQVSEATVRELEASGRIRITIPYTSAVARLVDAE